VTAVKLRWDLVALVYVVLAMAGGLLCSVVHGTSPMLHPSPRLALEPVTRESLSLVMGVALALLVVAVTRIAVGNAGWARRLHEELRPVAVGMGPGTVAVVALLSAAGEELFFRAFLTPLFGVIVQAVLFGLAHQVRGRSRWIYVGWATAVGLGLGSLHGLLGSLAGPLVAHALINAVNLAYLRDHDPARAAPRVGGLLSAAHRTQPGGGGAGAAKMRG
jgi:membrane protease YdiL (CAAX protease family)